MNELLGCMPSQPTKRKTQIPKGAIVFERPVRGKLCHSELILDVIKEENVISDCCDHKHVLSAVAGRAKNRGFAKINAVFGP